MSYSTSSEIDFKKCFTRATYLVLDLLVAISLSLFSLTSAPPVAKKKEKRTAFLYIAKRDQTLCTLLINTREKFVFYSIM